MKTLLAVAIATAPPDPPSPMMVATNGVRSDRQACGRTRDRFGLAAFFGADARISAGRVHQRNHRQPETLRHIEQALDLAVAFGHRHPEIVLHPRFRVVALLMAHDGDGHAAKPPEARDDGFVVAEEAIPASGVKSAMSPAT